MTRRLGRNSSEAHSILDLFCVYWLGWLKSQLVFSQPFWLWWSAIPKCIASKLRHAQPTVIRWQFICLHSRSCHRCGDRRSLALGSGRPMAAFACGCAWGLQAEVLLPPEPSPQPAWSLWLVSRVPVSALQWPNLYKCFVSPREVLFSLAYLATTWAIDKRSYRCPGCSQPCKL